MGRKIQITRAQILQAGLELIEREGAAAVQIKRLAASLGCSTQPILWQFGSMEAYRQALFQYAVEAVRQRIKPKGADAVLDFWRIGATYVDLAVDTPQLLRYLRADPAGLPAASACCMTRRPRPGLRTASRRSCNCRGMWPSSCCCF